MSLPLQTIAIILLVIPFQLVFATMQFMLDSDENNNYEIEFSSSAKEANDSTIESFKGNKFQKKEPIGSEYFRVRKIGDYNSKGYWSEYRKISEFTKSKSISTIRVEEDRPTKSDEVFIVLEQENGQKMFYLNGDKVGFEISKSKIGIDKTYYRLNGGDWNTYTEQGLRFINDGEYQMDYYSIDKVGNRETTKSVQFIVDLKAPFTELGLMKPDNIIFPNGFISGETRIQFNASDEVSGIDFTNYRFVCNNGKGNEFKKFTNPISIKEPIDYCKSGFQIQYYSSDKVGNREDIRTYLFSYEE